MEFGGGDGPLSLIVRRTEGPRVGLQEVKVGRRDMTGKRKEEQAVHPEGGGRPGGAFRSQHAESSRLKSLLGR